MTCFQFEPAPAGSPATCFVVVGGDLVPAGPETGVSVVASESLQSGDVGTILHVAPGGVYQSFGYKRRSSHFILVRPDGTTTEPSPGLLLAAGILRPKEEPPPAPPPAPFNAGMAEALRKAGLL